MGPPVRLPSPIPAKERAQRWTRENDAKKMERARQLSGLALGLQTAV